MSDLKNNIQVASEQIAWIKSFIADWRIIVADLRRAGYRTECAENTLGAFVSTLKTLESYEMCLRGEVKEQDGQRREMIAA